MYKKKKILAIIPARAGSKGIKKKNLIKINGISLLEYVFNALKNLEIIDRSLVSTDSNEIKRESERLGIPCTSLRPRKLSKDNTAILDVLKYEVNKIEKVESIVYDIIVLLEPTSPLRQSKDVEKAIKKLINTKLKSLWSVSKVDTKYNPLKQLKLEKSKLKYYDNKGKGVLFRQQLSDLYIRNGVVYVFTRDFIKRKKNLLDLETGYIVIDTPQISIDSNEDVGLVRYFLKN